MHQPGSKVRQPRGSPNLIAGGVPPLVKAMIPKLKDRAARPICAEALLEQGTEGIGVRVESARAFNGNSGIP
jgi:hypothetical protein